MSKAIILSRVSTLNQDLKQQTDEVVKFAEADGYSGDNVEVIEDKESGVKLSEEHRLGLIELKQKILANPGMYSCVYAYENQPHRKTLRGKLFDKEFSARE